MIGRECCSSLCCFDEPRTPNWWVPVCFVTLLPGIIAQFFDRRMASLFLSSPGKTWNLCGSSSRRMNVMCVFILSQTSPLVKLTKSSIHRTSYTTSSRSGRRFRSTGSSGTILLSRSASSFIQIVMLLGLNMFTHSHQLILVLILRLRQVCTHPYLVLVRTTGWGVLPCAHPRSRPMRTASQTPPPS